MKNSLRNDPTIMEKGIQRSNPCCSPNWALFFKWFLAFNFVLLLCFLGYALYGLYQLASAMRSTEEAIKLREDRYFDQQHQYQLQRQLKLQQLKQQNERTSFREWRKSIRQNKNGSVDVLLDAISSVINDFANVSSNGPPRGSGEIVVADLNDFEMRLLHEYSKMRVKDEGKKRAKRAAEDMCDIKVSIGSKQKGRPYYRVKPTGVGEGNINIRNSVNTFEEDKLVKTDVRRCSFNVILEPNEN